MARDEVVERIAEPVRRLACRKCGVSFDVAELPMLSPVTCPECGKEQTVPARLEGFLLIEPLGKGGMASVYRAYDETLGRLVAIKILRASGDEGSDAMQNFIREARAAAQLNHRNIVQVYTVGHTKGQAFLVMELLAGGRLDEMIAADRQVDEIRVLEIGIGIAVGLERANDIGLIHGDIKPANILFDREGTPKIADFGLARFKGAAVAHGEVWGTPYYIAPEKVRKQKEDHRSDIYSLGATLYHALGGQPPFDGRTATDVVVARLKEPPIRVESLRPNLHPATAEVVARMLEADRMRRYPTYKSLIADLRRAIDEVRTNPVKPQRGRGKGGRGRGRLWAAVAGLVLLGLLGGGAWWLWLRPAPEPTPPPDAVVAVDPADPGEPEAPEVPPGPEPAALALQPFSADESARLAETLGRMNEVSARRIEEDLMEQVRQLDRDHEGRPWYAFWYAFPVWMNGNAEEAGRRVRALRERTFEPPAEGVIHPGALARGLAHVIAGEAFAPPGRIRPGPVIETEEEAPPADGEGGGDAAGEPAADAAEPEPAGPAEGPAAGEQAAETEAAAAAAGPAAGDAPDAEQEPAAPAPVEMVGPELPAWYLDLADFVIGMDEVFRVDDRAVGRLRLARYLEAEPDPEAAWAYSARAVAERWISRLDAWDAFREGIEEEIEAGKGDEVLERIEQLRRAEEWGALRGEINQVRNTARRQKSRYDNRIAREQRRAEEAAQAEKMAEERAALEPVRAQIVPLVQGLDFSRALRTWDEGAAAIETEGVRAEAAAMRDALERMDRMRQFLRREVQRRPYARAERELRGNVVQAGPQGVSVELAGGVGTVERTWAQVGPRIFSDMVTFYLGETRMPDAERGELAAGLAVFFHLNQADRPAAVAVANALRWNPELAESLRPILPDAVPAAEE